jgi:hypothetical protein
MKKILFWLVTGFFFSSFTSAFCQLNEGNSDTVNDGPYIFNLNNKLRIKWIKNSVLAEDDLKPQNFPEIRKQFSFKFNYNDLINSASQKPDYIQCFENIDSIGVITDIHGEYHTYIALLKANGIIDENLNWKFGKGHLVILGDTFDRGDMVTEVFWHLFGLEKQAAEAGGMVHVVLGNHELLVLSKDLRYINSKYKKVELISETKYNDLYSEYSILGKWLRSKPIIITIDDILFVHAGVSIEMVHRNLKIKQINQAFTNNIVGKDNEAICENDQLFFLSDTEGPLWYRGYFTDKTFCESVLDSILDFYGKEHIVVGHTSFKDIRSLFNNKILAVDAGIMNELPGEMLIYKNGSFFKGYITGKRIEF